MNTETPVLRLLATVLALTLALWIHTADVGAQPMFCDPGVSGGECPSQAEMDDLCEESCGEPCGECHEFGGTIVYSCGCN